MKVKNLFLSMCAIAALASCSQNEDVPALTGDDAPEAKVTINFAGDGAATRAIGADDAKVNNLTAFFFNSSGALIKTPVTVESSKLNTTIVLATTTDASQVVLVANTAAGTNFAGVTNISKLKEFMVSSLGTVASGNYPVNQTATNLTMSGWGAITMNTTNNTGTAAVTLHFIAAKIKTLKVSWTGVNQGKYSDTEAALDGTDSWFTIKQAYLMMAQTNSTLIPDGATATAWTGKFTPNTFAYAGGLAWGAAPWLTAPAGTNPVKATDYLDITIPTSASNAVANILAGKPWYVFENNSSNPTGVILEVVCMVNDDAGTARKKTKYFTVYFGEKKTGQTGNQANIEGGKTYDINLTLNGSFDPSTGTGGGGTEDPTKPSVDANVTVTVTPATWTANVTIDKNFN